MKNLLLAALALVAVANTALADAVVVVRPAIGSGTAGILPQNAFSVTGAPSTPSNPTTPTNPGGPTTPTGLTVFTSVGFSAGAASDIDGTLGSLREYPMPFGNPYCEVVDSSPKSMKSLMDANYYAGGGSNTPAIMFKPKKVGVYKIAVSCGQSPVSHSPTALFNLTVN